MKVISKNKRATFDYDLKSRITVGLVLKGHEVKSVRAGNVSLVGSFASIRGGELWLNNAHIGAYKPARLEGYEPTTTRKLLAKKSELAKLTTAKQNGLNIVPVAIGLVGRFIKLEIGTGTSRKKYDKRQNIKQKDTDRDVQRSLRNN